MQFIEESKVVLIVAGFIIMLLLCCLLYLVRYVTVDLLGYFESDPGKGQEETGNEDLPNNQVSQEHSHHIVASHCQREEVGDGASEEAEAARQELRPSRLLS